MNKKARVETQSYKFRVASVSSRFKTNSTYSQFQGKRPNKIHPSSILTEQTLSY